MVLLLRCLFYRFTFSHKLRADLPQKAVKSEDSNRVLQILLMRKVRVKVSETPDSEGKSDRMGLNIVERSGKVYKGHSAFTHIFLSDTFVVISLPIFNPL